MSSQDEEFDLKVAHRNALLFYNTRKHSTTKEIPVDAINFSQANDIERVKENTLKTFNTSKRNIQYEGMKVLINDHVFRISGGVLIAQDAKRLRKKAVKFTIQGVVVSEGKVYVSVRITKPGGKSFLKEGQVVKVPREYLKIIGLKKDNQKKN